MPAKPGVKREQGQRDLRCDPEACSSGDFHGR